MIHEWDLAETNLGRLEKRKYEVAVLPTAAIEPHNRHLPEGQDWLHTTWVSKRVCEMAWPRCESVLCLPAIPYGVDCNLLDFPLAMHVSQETLDHMVRDIITSLAHYDIRKIVILNGHGGNDFTPLIRQIQCDLDVHVFICDWWKVGLDRYDEIFSDRDDHAGQMETSVGLALFPHLVELDQADSIACRPWRFEALEKGWARTSRRFSRLNNSCASSDPEDSSAEKGVKYLEVVCERVADFLVQLAKSPIDDFFPQLEE